MQFGRNIQRNSKKYLQFVLTGNITTFAFSILAACIDYQPPFTVLQLFCITLFQNMVAVYIIATIKPRDDWKTDYQQKNIVSKTMWIEILSLAGFQILILLLLILLGDQMFCLPYQLDTPDYVTWEMV